MARSHGKGGVDVYITGQLHSMVKVHPGMPIEEMLAKLYVDIPDEQFKRMLACCGTEETTAFAHLREIFADGAPPPDAEMVRKAFFHDMCIYYAEGDPDLRHLITT